LVAVLWLGGPVGDIKQPPRKPLEEVAMWLWKSFLILFYLWRWPKCYNSEEF
jgi:hypothetical protein